MKIVRIIFGTILVLWSLLLILEGSLTWQSMQGQVTGSEFGMLIGILKELGMILVWLGLYSIWNIIPKQKNGENETQNGELGQKETIADSDS